MKKISISSILWLIPFFIFIAGYITLYIAFPEQTIEVPNVVGKTLHEAAKNIAQQQLNMRIIAEKDEPDLPDGTVLIQKPFHTKVRKNQPIFLTISRKRCLNNMESFIGKHKEAIEEYLNSKKIKYKITYLPSLQPQGTCIGQIPQAGEQLADNKATIFLSKNQKKPIIWPNFKGIPIDEVIDFLKKYAIEPTIIYESPTSDSIAEQRPLAGSIVDVQKVKVFFRV